VAIRHGSCALPLHVYGPPPRRQVTNRIVGITALGLLGLALAGCASQSSDSYNGRLPHPVALPAVSDSGRDLTADQQVLQALNRLAFGPRPGDVARVRQMGVDRWMARQLSPESINDSTTDAFVARFPTYTQTVAQLETLYPPGNKVLMDRRGPATPGVAAKPVSREDSVAVQTAERSAAHLIVDLQTVKVARAVMSERQLQEVMVDFWENHFTVYDRKGQRMRYFLAEFDRDVIRPNALGNFHDLLEAVAKSPAMLFYLDNWESAADSTQPTLDPRPHPGQKGLAIAPPRRRGRGLNENYGRELLELHTLGVDGGYTQQDVIAVARALTGWSITPPPQGTSAFLFQPQFHDAGVKVVLGHTLAAGRGIEDGEDVINIVSHHPSTARFIARKLCIRFVSDSPPPALIDRAAATFTRTNGDIRQVVWTIVSSPEFFSRSAYRKKVKSPFEVVVSALRAVDADPDSTQRTAQIIARMGQPIFGHQAPNGYPETGESWMNTGAILNRINFGLAVAANQIPGASLSRWPDARALATAPRTAQVDGVVADVLGGDVSPDTRAVLLSGDHPLLASGASTNTSATTSTTDQHHSGDPYALPAQQPPMTDGSSTMTDGQMDGGIKPANRPAGGGGGGGGFGGLKPAPQLQGLAQVVGLALGAPEFQRR
jgi:uncharacterized protein (DUF1800 family)